MDEIALVPAGAVMLQIEGEGGAVLGGRRGLISIGIGQAGTARPAVARQSRLGQAVAGGEVLCQALLLDPSLGPAMAGAARRADCQRPQKKKNAHPTRMTQIPSESNLMFARNALG